MKLGKNFKIGYIDADGRFLPLAFAQSASIDRKTSSTDVSSPLTGGWEERRPKRNSWSMQHEGLLGSNAVTYQYNGKGYGFYALMKKLWADKYIFPARWQEVLEDGTPGEIVQGQCFIEDMKQVASEKALTKISIKLAGTGELRDLSAEDLTGAFAYAIQGHTLTLYAVQRPVTGFTVHAGTTAVGAWDDTATGRMQSFTNDAVTASSVITAWKGEGAAATEQTGVTFTDSSTMHVVLLQTEERDSMQQLHRYVQPLWWGGLSMGDMTLTKNGTAVVTFATAGQTGSSTRVEIDAATDITGDGTWALTTDAPQTLHCTDRTTTTQRTVGTMQTRRNADGGAPYTGTAIVSPVPFGCDVTIWANDADGNEVMRTSVIHDTRYSDTNSTALIPDAQHIHFQIEGLGTGDGGPYTIDKSLVYDLEPHEVYYAYDAATQVMRIFAPVQRYTTVLMLDGTAVHTGLFYTTDAEGNHHPVTLTGIPSFSTISTSRGTYTFHDVSAVRMFNLSNTFAIDKMPLYDIILTGEGGAQVGTLPALSSPARTYPTYELVDVPGSVITGAQMPTGAAQSLSYDTYFQTVIVKTAATYNATSGTWSVTVRLLGNSDGSGGAAVLPARLDLRWGTNAAVSIAAGQSGVTASGLTYNPAWITPTASLSSAEADYFNIFTAPTPDITEDHWVAYKLGLVNTVFYYDVAYTGGSHQEIRLTGSFMETAAPIRIVAGQEVADRLYVATSSSEDNVSVAARSVDAPEWSAATIEHINVNTTDKLVLSYRLGVVGSTTVTNLTNIKEYADSVPVYSRHSCIADILPFVKVVLSYSPIYNSVGLEGLKPSSTIAFEAQALYGIYSGDDSAEGAMAVFSDSNGNTISVGSGLTGVKVLAVNHSAELPFA